MAKLTKTQTDKKEKIVKAMKRNKSDFEKRYGDDAKSVMYATATKLSKNESVEFSVSFGNSIDATSFANQLKEYKISKNEWIQTESNGGSSVIFETNFDNYDFIQWLSAKNMANDYTLCYEEFLPTPSNRITGNNAMTFSKFSRQTSSINYDIFFAEERLHEADDAYAKTRAYKKLKGDKKDAVDYFMKQIEKHGLEKIDKVSKDATVRYNISSKELDDFLETIFFSEDIKYIRSLTEAEQKQDPVKQKAEKDREEKQKQNAKDAEKEKDKKDEKKKEASKTQQQSTDNKQDKKDEMPAANNKTFKNFKSELKPGEKGQPSVTDSGDQEDQMKLEKPQKGSPVEDAEIDGTTF